MAQIILFKTLLVAVLLPVQQARQGLCMEKKKIRQAINLEKRGSVLQLFLLWDLIANFQACINAPTGYSTVSCQRNILVVQVHTACKNVGTSSDANRMGSPAPCFCHNMAEPHRERSPCPLWGQRTPLTIGEQTGVGSSSCKREEGREIMKRESSEASKPYSTLLEQVHEHCCGSVQMPGRLDEHLDHLDCSQNFDYWSELCLLTFVHCLCLCCGEQGLAGDELTAEQASSGLHINTSCALASHSIPRVGVLGRDTLCCLPDGTQRVFKKAWKTTCK